MYRSASLRIAIVIAFGVAAVYSPQLDGHPYILDAWLWRSLRDVIGNHVWQLPLMASAVMVAADCLGAFLPPLRLPVHRPRQWALVITIGAAVVLWLLRVHNWLGDYPDMDRAPLPWWKLEAAEPLGALTAYYTLHWGVALGWPQSTATAFVITGLGATAIAAMFLWARLVSAEWPLVFLMLASCGSVVLFFGYPEKGTPKSVALITWYVYFATRALREETLAPRVAANFFLSVAALMHGSVLCFLPAHLWYLWRRQPRSRLALGLLAFLAPLAAMGWYAHTGAPFAGGRWGNIAAPWQWIKAYCITNCGYDFFSFSHLADIGNCLLILSPVAVLCLPEALWRGRDGTARWLALGALGWLFLSVTWFPVYGYLSDWDIFAGTPLVISYLAIYVALQVMPPARFRRLACLWIAGSLIHTGAWWRAFHLPPS